MAGTETPGWQRPQFTLVAKQHLRNTTEGFGAAVFLTKYEEIRKKKSYGRYRYRIHVCVAKGLVRFAFFVRLSLKIPKFVSLNNVSM